MGALERWREIWHRWTDREEAQPMSTYEEPTEEPTEEPRPDEGTDPQADPPDGEEVVQTEEVPPTEDGATDPNPESAG
jgi:hypothetical protein